MNKNYSIVLVTGGCGFIGSRLVATLVQSGCDVTVVDHSKRKGVSPRISGAAKVIESNLGDALQAQLLNVDSFDVIFHLAGNSSVQNSIADPISDFAGVEQTILLMEALRYSSKAPLLIFPSSAAVYGEPLTMPIKETDPTVPLSPYGVGKLASERYIDVYSKLYALRSVCLRPFSVYGPGQTKQVIFDMIDKLAKDSERLEVIGNGEQQRDFIYIDDLIELMLLCCNLNLKPGQNEVFNAATGVSTSIADLVGKIVQAMNAHPQLKYSGESRPGEPHIWQVDISKARAIGFQPRTSLSDGLARVVSQFRASVAPDRLNLPASSDFIL